MNTFTSDEFLLKVVNDYSDMIIRIAFQYTKNRPDAEDIMQDVLVSLVKQCDTAKLTFQSEAHLKAWLIRVVINKAKDYLRMAKRRKFESLDKAEHVLTNLQEEVLEELDQLSEDDRNCIYLFYYEKYTAKEIATIFQSQEKAVLMRLSRARKKLKFILETEI